jgi:hypothetical protein
MVHPTKINDTDQKCRRLLYKCRRCGRVDDAMSGGSRTALIDLIDLISHGKVSKPGACGHRSNLRMTDMCCCKDGGYGVQDLIGISPET